MLQFLPHGALEAHAFDALIATVVEVDGPTRCGGPQQGILDREKQTARVALEGCNQHIHPRNVDTKSPELVIALQQMRQGRLPPGGQKSADGNRGGVTRLVCDLHHAETGIGPSGAMPQHHHFSALCCRDCLAQSCIKCLLILKVC